MTLEELAEQRADFHQFLAAFPPPVHDFLAEVETRVAMDRAAARLRENHTANGIGGTSEFNEGMIEGLKCGLVVFFDMCAEGEGDSVMEACLMGGIVSSIAFIEMCYTMLAEGGTNDEPREPDGA